MKITILECDFCGTEYRGSEVDALYNDWRLFKIKEAVPHGGSLFSDLSWSRLIICSFCQIEIKNKSRAEHEASRKKS